MLNVKCGGKTVLFSAHWQADMQLEIEDVNLSNY